MKIRIAELRRIINEIVADHMRLPRGPNSRDDAPDRKLDDPMKDRVNVEEMDSNLAPPGTRGYSAQRGISTNNRSNNNSGSS